MKKIKFLSFVWLILAITAFGAFVNAQSRNVLNDTPIRWVVTTTGLPCNPAAKNQVLAYDFSAPNQGLYRCSGANTWTAVASGGGGGSLSVGDSVGSATQGSVFFAGASGVLAQANSNFFWNDSDKRLQLSNTSTNPTLTLTSTADYPVFQTFTSAQGTGRIKGGYQGFRLQSGQFTQSNAGIEFGDTSEVVVAGFISTAQTPFNNIRAQLNADQASVSPLVLQLASGQTANSLSVVNSAVTTVFNVDKDGFVTSGSAGTTRIAQNNSYIEFGANNEVSTRVGDKFFETFHYTFERVYTPPAVSADTNDYQLFSYPIARISSDASRNLTGVVTPASVSTLTTGAMPAKMLINVGANPIVLKHEDAASTAANRFLNSTGADITLSPNEAADMFYDFISSRWRVFKKS